MTRLQEYDQDFDNYEPEQYRVQFKNSDNLQLPAKQHIQQIENNIQQYNDDSVYLNEQKTELKADYENLVLVQNQTLDRINMEMLQESKRCLQDFRQLVQLAEEEKNFLSNQNKSLNNDKIKIHQNTLVLETRVQELEHTMGFK